MSGRCDDEDSRVLPFPDLRNAATGERVFIRMSDTGAPEFITRLRPGHAVEAAFAELRADLRELGEVVEALHRERQRLAASLENYRLTIEPLSRAQFVLTEKVASLAARLGLPEPPSSQPEGDGA